PSSQSARQSGIPGRGSATKSRSGMAPRGILETREKATSGWETVSARPFLASLGEERLLNKSPKYHSTSRATASDGTSPAETSPQPNQASTQSFQTSVASLPR